MMALIMAVQDLPLLIVRKKIHQNHLLLQEYVMVHLQEYLQKQHPQIFVKQELHQQWWKKMENLLGRVEVLMVGLMLRVKLQKKINQYQQDAVEAIRQATGNGVDLSFEVTGVPPVLKQALAAVHNDGECVIVSIWESEASIHPNEIVIKEKTLKGIIAYRDIFPAVLKLMEQGYFSKDKLVTRRITLDRIVDEGFEALAREKSQVKILVSPQ